jgi:hypothetical protein
MIVNTEQNSYNERSARVLSAPARPSPHALLKGAGRMADSQRTSEVDRRPISCPICSTEARPTEYRNYYVCANGHVSSDRPGRHGEARRPIALRIISRPGCVPIRYDFVRVHPAQGERKTVSVHLLVADAWLPPRPNDLHQLRHLDGCPHHNWASNLAWGTPTENHHDMRRHGTDPIGSRNPRATLRSLGLITYPSPGAAAALPVLFLEN